MQVCVYSLFHLFIPHSFHPGAGSFNQKKENSYFDLCSKACDVGIESFECGMDPIDVVSKVMQTLEDSELTNAGYGSNICWDGSVECDASIMSGWDMKWSGVGAMSGVKNPVIVARELHKAQDEKTVCGLVTPILLCGKGAADFAASRGFKTDSILSCDRSLTKFKAYKRKFDTAQAACVKEKRLDTIGAIVVSRDGQVASAVSSGGVAFKTPGRVGQAAVFGAGCWAQDGFGSTTSGTGEHLIKTNFARELNDCLVNMIENENLYLAAERAFVCKFMKSRFLKDVDVENRLGGFLATVRDPETSRLELVCGHNTPSMIYSFRSSKTRKASSFFSKFNDRDHDVKIECHLI